MYTIAYTHDENKDLVIGEFPLANILLWILMHLAVCGEPALQLVLDREVSGRISHTDPVCIGGVRRCVCIERV